MPGRGEGLPGRGVREVCPTCQGGGKVCTVCQQRAERKTKQGRENTSPQEHIRTCLTGFFWKRLLTLQENNILQYVHVGRTHAVHLDNITHVSPLSYRSLRKQGATWRCVVTQRFS